MRLLQHTLPLLFAVKEVEDGGEGNGDDEQKPDQLRTLQLEHMRALLGLEPGSVSVLGLLNDRERRVHLLVDAALLQDEWLGCHPCRNTSTLRIAMHDVTERILPHLGYAPTVVTLPDDPE